MPCTTRPVALESVATRGGYRFPRRTSPSGPRPAPLRQGEAESYRRLMWAGIVALANPNRRPERILRASRGRVIMTYFVALSMTALMGALCALIIVLPPHTYGMMQWIAFGLTVVSLPL